MFMGTGETQDISYDVYIYVDSSTEALTSKTWGAPCAVDNNGYVIAGRIWINLSEIGAISDEDMFSGFLRALLHAIGLHSSVYQYWRDPSNSFAAYPGNMPYEV
jgi:hypothetical protein